MEPDDTQIEVAAKLLPVTEQLDASLPISSWYRFRVSPEAPLEIGLLAITIANDACSTDTPEPQLRDQWID